MKNGVNHLIDINVNRVKNNEINMIYGLVGIVIGIGLYKYFDKIKKFLVW